MELIVTAFLRKERGKPVEPIGDILIRDLPAKMPDEVLEEITDQLESPIEIAFIRTGLIDTPAPDREED